MLPDIASSLIQTSIACGACVDQNLIGLAPFLLWWVWVFVLWSLLVGPLVFRFTNAHNATELRNPARSFLWLLGLLVVSIFVTGGSVLLPFILLAPFWIAALVHGVRCPARGWSRFCLTVAGVMLLLVPVSYVFPLMKPRAAHGQAAAARDQTRTAPTTAPATPVAPAPAPTSLPAPTLRDALPGK